MVRASKDTVSDVAETIRETTVSPERKSVVCRSVVL